jgi:hypothetical protein
MGQLELVFLLGQFGDPVHDLGIVHGVPPLPRPIMPWAAR